jgi:hypothetical protein
MFVFVVSAYIAADDHKNVTCEKRFARAERGDQRAEYGPLAASGGAPRKQCSSRQTSKGTTVDLYPYTAREGIQYFVRFYVASIILHVQDTKKTLSLSLNH